MSLTGYRIAIKSSSVSAASVSAGQTETIKVGLVPSFSLSNAIASVRVVDSNGKLISEKLTQPANLVANQLLPMQYAFVPSSSLPLGTYSVVAAVWSGDWSKTYLYAWTNSKFQVMAAGSVSAPSPSPSFYTLSTSSPVGNSTVSGTTSVVGNAPGFLNVEIFSSSGTLLARATPSSTGAFSASVNFSQLSAGNQVLKLQAWDSAAGQPYTHTAQASLSVNVGSVSPAPSPSPSATSTSTPTPSPTPTPSATLSSLFTISSPSANSSFSAPFSVKGSAGSQWVNVAAYDLSNGSAKVGNDVAPVNGSYSLSIDPSQLTAGAHNLAITAFSVAAGVSGGTSTSLNLSVNIVATAPSPSPSPSPSASPTMAAGDLNILSYGAVASATANNLTAIQNAINAAQSKGVNVFVPAGTFGYSGVIHINGAVKLYGIGSASILNALDALNETIMLQGSGGSVSYLHLTVGYGSASRQDPYECQRVTLLGASNFLVDHLIIDGGSAAGIMAAQAANHGVISHNLVQNTLADSIHMTDGSNYIQVLNNETNNSGDDGIAVVSYSGNSGPVHDIQAYNNHIHHNAWGRGMTVVGGNNVTYTNNYIHDNMGGGSCFYIAQESSYTTMISTNVTIQNNTVKNCGGMGGGHGGILVWGDAQANNTIKLVNNLVDQSANTNPTIVIQGLNQNVSLINNEILGVPISIQSGVIQNTPYPTGAAVGYSGSIGP